METRLSLRRRLLRIDDSDTAAASAALDPVVASSSSGQVFNRSNQSRGFAGRRQQPQQEFEDEEDDGDGEGDADEEGDDEESGNDDNDDGGRMEVDATGRATKTLRPGEKCPTAPVVKLVFSRSDPSAATRPCASTTRPPSG